MVLHGVRTWLEQFDAVDRVFDRFEKTKHHKWQDRAGAVVETSLDIMDDFIDALWELPMLKRHKFLADNIAYYSLYFGVLCGALASILIVYYYFNDPPFHRFVDALNPFIQRIIILSMVVIFALGVSIWYMHDELENEWYRYIQIAEARAWENEEDWEEWGEWANAGLGDGGWDDFIDPARIGRPPYVGENDSWWYYWYYADEFPSRRCTWFNEHLGSRNQIRRARNAGFLGMNRHIRTKRAVQPERIRRTGISSSTALPMKEHTAGGGMSALNALSLLE